MGEIAKAVGILLAVAFVLVLLGCIIGDYVAGERWKREVVDMGLASYQCDPATGEVEFVWRGKE